MVMRYDALSSPRHSRPLRARGQGLDDGHAPAGIALVAGEAVAYLMREPVCLSPTPEK
jgi:hypothetical protein